MLPKLQERTWNLQLFNNIFSISPNEAELEAQLEPSDLQSCKKLQVYGREFTCLPRDQYPNLCTEPAIYACLLSST